MTGGRHLLVVGAGLNQLGTIERAKRAGLRVTATDRDPEAAGFAVADDAVLASTRDPEETLAAIRPIHERTPIDGVMTIASESAVTVAAVAQALGLPGVGVEAARRATDKLARLAAFAAAGVPSARSATARSADDVRAAGDELGWPVVVKPVDSAGSRGVRRIDRPDQVDAAVAEITGLSSDARIVVEELLTGTEHSIEGIVIDGTPHWTAFSDRNYADKERYAPHFFEDGDTLPTRLPSVAVDGLLAASDAAVRALGIEHGPVKGDLLLGSAGPVVIEMAARLSGDGFCEHTAPLHNGIDLVGVVMDQALGHRIDPRRLRPSRRRPVAYRGVWVDAAGSSSVDLERLGTAVGVVRAAPDDTTTTGGAVRRVATVHATGHDRDEAVANARRAVEAAQAGHRAADLSR